METKLDLILSDHKGNFFHTWEMERLWRHPMVLQKLFFSLKNFNNLGFSWLRMDLLLQELMDYYKIWYTISWHIWSYNWWIQNFWIIFGTKLKGQQEGKRNLFFLLSPALAQLKHHQKRYIGKHYAASENPLAKFHIHLHYTSQGCSLCSKWSKSALHYYL